MGTQCSSKFAVKESILLSLLAGKKDVATLTEETKIIGSTILHVLKQLEKSELTVKTSGVYSLTSLGVIEAQICIWHRLSSNTIKVHKDFWLHHDVTSIPSTLMMNIGALSESTLLQATPDSLEKVHTYFIGLLSAAKTIFGVSPIFHPDYANVFKELLNQGVKIQLIATPEVLTRFKQVGADVLDAHVPTGDLQLFVKDKVGYAITATDKAYSFGLFSLTGRYDPDADIVGEDEQGRAWVYQLFKHTLTQSIPYVYAASSTHEEE